MRTYDEIKAAVISKGYSWFDGDLNLNFIWERTSDEVTNKFTDLLHLAFEQDGKNIVITIPATTKPGLHGSIDEPITYEGITGTAVIVPGQYRGAWEFRDTFSEFLNYPYFRQVRPVNYWRDGDKDLVIDHVQQQDAKVFGTHWHRMSRPGMPGGNVDNWSKGCMGMPEPELKKILPIIRASLPKYGKRFTGTLIESKDFKIAAQ